MVGILMSDHNMRTNTEDEQVLFKRKPITIHPPQTNIPDNAEVGTRMQEARELGLTLPSQVWVMKGTNEVFADYEKYLKRSVSPCDKTSTVNALTTPQIRLPQPGKQHHVTVYTELRLTICRKSSPTLSMASPASPFSTH